MQTEKYSIWNRVFTGHVRKSRDWGNTIDTRPSQYRGTFSSTRMFCRLGSAAFRIALRRSEMDYLRQAKKLWTLL